MLRPAQHHCKRFGGRWRQWHGDRGNNYGAPAFVWRWRNAFRHIDGAGFGKEAWDCCEVLQWRRKEDGRDRLFKVADTVILFLLVNGAYMRAYLWQSALPMLKR